jgi:Subtilase family
MRSVPRPRLRSRAWRALTAHVAVLVLAGFAAAGVAEARLPNDPALARDYWVSNPGQPVDGAPAVDDADIDAPEAWDVTTGSPSVTVAMVDDGVDFLQADLAPNLLTGGYDYADGDADPSSPAGSNHGTQTASVVGARGDNARAVTGVNWNVGLLPLKVRKDGPGSRQDLIPPSAVAAAFRSAGARGIRVANASFGLSSTTSAEARAEVLAALKASPDTLFVVSAGNSEHDNDLANRYPCDFDVPNLLCVGASDASDQLASFSNYGARSVDLVAPGAKIYTVNGRTIYGYVDGTSYSAPLVSGVAALYLARYPWATTAQVEQAILDGVDVKPAFVGRTVTGGRLNAARTLAIVPPTAAQDDFSRTTTDGWGTAPSGGPWSVVAGGAAPFSTDGSEGLIAVPTGGQERHIGLRAMTPIRDTDARMQVTFPGSAGSSGSYYAYLTLRNQAADGSSLRVGLVAQGRSLLIRSQTSSGATLRSNVNTNLGFVPGTRYLLRVQALGAGPTAVRARAWKAGTPEPATWPLDVTTTLGPQVAGTVGIRASNDTLTPTTLRFDDLAAAAFSSPAP